MNSVHYYRETAEEKGIALLFIKTKSSFVQMLEDLKVLSF